MLVQASLYGKPADPPIRVYRRDKEDKPWKGVCCKSCWNAKGEKCRCRCKHENHGKGHMSFIVHAVFAKEGSNPESGNPEALKEA